MGNLLTDIALIEARMEELIKKLIEKYMREYQNQSGSRYIHAIDYEIETGKKYHKIMMIDHPGTDRQGRSVHAFVSRQTGAVFKPASWRGPAKIARYNLLDDISYQQCLDRADWCGAYLYLR